MSVLKTTIPNYLSGLPIPDTVGGWFKLGVKDWISLVPVGAAIGGLVYMSYLAFCPKAKCHQPNGRCNVHICLTEDKIVNTIDIEDIAEKAALCRCWKTKNWPYCDGSHTEHNKITGDNVGPVVLKRKAV